MIKHWLKSVLSLKSYAIIICPISTEKLRKNLIWSRWIQFEYWSNYSPGFHEVIIGLNLHVQWVKSATSLSWFEHRSKSLLPSRQWYLVIICPNSHANLTKYKILSNYYIPQFGLIYSYLATIYHFSPYLAIVTYIYRYLGLFDFMESYLLFTSHIYHTYVPPLRLHLCAQFERIGPLLEEILDFQIIGGYVRTDIQTGGGGGGQYLPSRTFGATGDLKKIFSLVN